MKNFRRFFCELRDDEHGATLTEYALIILLIAVATFTAAQILGTSAGNPFTDVANGMNAAAP